MGRSYTYDEISSDISTCSCPLRFTVNMCDLGMWTRYAQTSWQAQYSSSMLSMRGFQTISLILQCVQKKRHQNVFVISSTKLGRFWCNLVYTVSWVNLLKKCVNNFHLSWIMSLHYLVKLEMFITPVLPLHCQRKKLQNLSYLNCGLQILEIWIQLITACWNTAREGVQDMHHWSGWTETATENGVDQAGSCRHCSSHSSMASSIVADHWSVFCTPLLQYFPHNVINWIQIWRICRPQLRLEFLLQLNCSTCAMSILSFTR